MIVQTPVQKINVTIKQEHISKFYDIFSNFLTKIFTHVRKEDIPLKL